MSLNACREEGLRDLDTSPDRSNIRTYKLKSKSDDEKYGNAIKKKKEHDVRIAVLNVNSFPRTKQKQDKLILLDPPPYYVLCCRKLNHPNNDAINFNPMTANDQ